MPDTTGPCLLLLDNRMETWAAASLIVNEWRRPVYLAASPHGSEIGAGTTPDALANYWGALQLRHQLTLGDQLPVVLEVPSRCRSRWPARLLDRVARYYGLRTVVFTWKLSPTEWRSVDPSIHHPVLRPLFHQFLEQIQLRRLRPLRSQTLMLFRYCPDDQCSGSRGQCPECTNLRRWLLDPRLVLCIRDHLVVQPAQHPRHEVNGWNQVVLKQTRLLPKVPGREVVKVRSVLTS